jgi:hypothetical protein
VLRSRDGYKSGSNFTWYMTSSGHSVGSYYVRFLQSVRLHKQYMTSWPSPRQKPLVSCTQRAPLEELPSMGSTQGSIFHSLFHSRLLWKLTFLARTSWSSMSVVIWILFLGSTHIIAVPDYFYTKRTISIHSANCMFQSHCMLEGADEEIRTV